MSQTTPVVSIHDLELVPRPEAWSPPPTARRRFDAKSARVAQRMGLKKLGCQLTQVAPGCAAYPFHSHRANDELFYIVEGRGKLRFGDTLLAVTAGDLIGCPAGGATTAHQLINSGEVALTYLAISTMIDPEICEYPDSGKVGAYDGQGDDELMVMSPYKSGVDYWDGE